MEKVATVTATRIMEEASRLAVTVEAGNFKPLVHLALVGEAEDPALHMLLITGSGARLYFSLRPPGRGGRLLQTHTLIGQAV